ncbi:hypothetical protein ACB092_03G038100 [Castanea dentata]
MHKAISIKRGRTHNTQKCQGIVPTPMVLWSNSNRGPSRGLVKMSAFWLSVCMNSRLNFFFHQISDEVVAYLYVF